ncbi:cutinase [Mycobacterium malmoense]|uniref:Cutinase n=1 Tax=Mycobacterium malmoense TaxID=1780 RepID=A0A1B9CZF3_MYCMA|nr:cutinase family protein [Mycobacterium malmoense]OCB21232.1 cutinase [Mycobacterium malmoense]OCB35379.1 cutinase [Mycobacterium malmoense]OCB36417.1 cutinase [Mycobacterium malmoense]OCB48127.1 cutinase [Mycobacterium malmoense]
MATNARRKRHRVLAWTAALTMAGVVLLVIVAVVVLLRGREAPPSAVPPGVLPPPSTTTHPHKPRPATQDASCPDVQLVNVPGTWESAPQDDPANPVQFPNALLHKVTAAITQEFPSSRVQEYTTPYTAQFHNPLSGDTQMSYNASRAEGTRATVQAMTDMNAKCPLTSYVLMGFSQGAVIAGDIASDIGNGRGPVDDDLVLGVTLIADGRRQPGVGNDIGPNPPGQGAEITLHEVPVLSDLGLTMTGARPGGFGALDGKTNEICAPGDLICAAPQEAFSVANLPSTLNTLAGNGGQPIHALYATPQFWNADGQTATDWTLNWARGLITNAPHPKHG